MPRQLGEGQSGLGEGRYSSSWVQGWRFAAGGGFSVDRAFSVFPLEFATVWGRERGQALPSTQPGKFRISVCLNKQAGRLGHQEEEGGMNLGMEAVEKGP